MIRLLWEPGDSAPNSAYETREGFPEEALLDLDLGK